MNFVSVPLSGFFSPSDTDMNRVLADLQNPDLLPILIHCQHGEDRTGLAVGLYRVLVQNVAPKDAYQEMLDHGFHPLLLGLKDYFEDRTGFDP